MKIILDIIYDLVPKGAQEKRTEVLENKVDRMWVSNAFFEWTHVKSSTSEERRQCCSPFVRILTFSVTKLAIEVRVAPGLANCSWKTTTKTKTRAPYCIVSMQVQEVNGGWGGGGGGGGDLADQWFQPKWRRLARDQQSQLCHWLILSPSHSALLGRYDTAPSEKYGNHGFLYGRPSRMSDAPCFNKQGG